MGINLKNAEIKILKETLEYLKSTLLYTEPEPTHLEIVRKYEELMAEIDNKVIEDRAKVRVNMQRYRERKQPTVTREYYREYYKNNKEKIKEYQHKYYLKRKETRNKGE